jgi:signal transduction histidine kinase
MEQTIRTFLDYARPPQLQRQRLVLRHLLRQTVEFVTPRAQRLGVQVRCLTPDPVVEVEVDAGQMRQVVLNLLLNALDASSTGQTITVRMSQEIPSNASSETDVSGGQRRWIVVEVMDQGPGLPATIKDRIFEPFVSSKEEGAGLGLPICRRIVEEHGGQIKADNRQEGGAVFTVKLPVTATGENVVSTRAGSDKKTAN